MRGPIPKGATFFSDSADLRGANFGTSGNSIKVLVRKAKVVLNLPEGVPAPRMRLWFRGFKSFRNPLVKMSLGVVEVYGEGKDVAQDDMSGCVTVQAEADTDLDGWVERADDFLTFMHRGLGFANGGRLQTPRLDLLVDNRWEATYYEGDGFGRGLPPVHHLNQGPIIEALARRFDDPRPFPDMLWAAISWLHNDNRFDEGRFLMSMTALETIVEHVIPKTLTTVMSKPDFNAVREKLFAALAETGIDSISLEIYQGKISNLNGRTLAQKIGALRDHYGLPQETFSDEAILAVIRARNGIVHTGESSGRREIWPKVVFVRELISHIVFQEIGYSGPYESYVGGYRMVHPELEKLTSAENTKAGP